MTRSRPSPKRPLPAGTPRPHQGLTEHELRLFEQGERSLAEDPEFAARVRSTEPTASGRGWLLVGAIVAILAIITIGVGTYVLTR
jgi:hypothetical protein